MSQKPARSAQKIPNQFLENAFLNLLGDAIENAYLASAIPNPGSKARFIRFSIISSALAVECATNAAFGHINFPQATLKKIERHLSLFDKIELVSMAVHGESRVDRGNAHCQRIGDLINIRNSYVHPKILPHPVISKDEKKRQISVFCGTYEYLKVDKSFYSWKDSDPQIVLKAVEGFLDYFLIENCAWTSQYATDVLTPKLWIDNKLVPTPLTHDIELVYKAKELWKMRFRFLDLESLRLTGVYPFDKADKKPTNESERKRGRI
jgi:hypothetical protein